MNSKYSIEFKNLTKKFGDSIILNNLNFGIHKNKITTILGFSGAGKTTLMKHILGLVMPTEGEVKVLGTTINKLSELQLREFRRNFGMVFQYLLFLIF